jgi:hypothetical protein
VPEDPDEVKRIFVEIAGWSAPVKPHRRPVTEVLPGDVRQTKDEVEWIRG